MSLGGAGRGTCGASATITGPWLCVGGARVHTGECVYVGIQGAHGHFEGSCEAQGPGRAWDGRAGEVTPAKVQREEWWQGCQRWGGGSTDQPPALPSTPTQVPPAALTQGPGWPVSAAGSISCQVLALSSQET